MVGVEFRISRRVLWRMRVSACLKTDRRSRTRTSRYLLNLELQVRGLITVFSHQPDNSSVTTTGLVVESLDALASGSWILIG